MIAINRLSLSAATSRTIVLVGIVVGMAWGQLAMAEDTLDKSLLMRLSRAQSEVLCNSEGFKSCMGFTQETCFELSEKALQQCIVPLPDTILLTELNNDALEACPQKIYADAGFSDEKAVACLTDVLEEKAKP